MRILVLHRIPFHKVRYDRGIDHQRHEVVYVGTAAALKTIPAELRAIRIERPGTGRVADEVVVAALASGERYDRVISLSEYELLDAAEVRERLGVSGPSVADVTVVRNKVVMKERVVAAGIAAPRHVLVAQAPDVLPWTGRTILKPVDGASSENVRELATAQEALAAARAPGLDAQRFELEEFVEGPIVHFDGFVAGGEVQAMLASRYVGTCLGYALGAPLGSVQFEAGPELEAWARRCVGAVGLRDSSFHLESILSERGPVFLEIAARVGGADVVDCFELATGLYLPAMELAAIVGEPAPDPGGRGDGRRYGWFVVPGHHLDGVTCEIEGLDGFERHPHIVRLLRLAPDAPLPRKITYQSVEVPVAGVVGAPTTQAAEVTIRDLFHRVRVYPRRAAS
jgi:biotin carboxylase